MKKLIIGLLVLFSIEVSATPFQKDVSWLQGYYKKISALQKEIEDNGNTIIIRSRKNKNTVSLKDRTDWGRLSSDWNKRLRDIKSSSYLKNKKTPVGNVVDRGKLEVSLYAESIVQMWQYLNSHISGKTVESWKWTELGKDIKSSTTDALLVIEVLKSGSNELKVFDDFQSQNEALKEKEKK